MEYTDVFRQGLGEWSPNGKFLAGAQQNRLQIREHDSLKLLQVFICIDKVERIEWSPDSQLILTEVARPGPRLLQIWSLRDSEWTCRIYEGLAGIAHARWADAETVLVTVEFQLYVSIWQLQEGSSAVQIHRPKFKHRGVAFSRDGCWLAALRRVECKDKLSVYNAEGKFSCLTDVVLPGDAANLVWGPDDNTLVVWEMPGRIPWCRMRLGCSGRNQGMGMVADVAQVYSGRRMSGATWGWLSEVSGCITIDSSPGSVWDRWAAAAA
eukprot:symbB.v1.2.017219.t1/scaffold1333.1/size124786/5